MVEAGTTWGGLTKYGKWVCLVGSGSKFNGTQSESQSQIFQLNNGATVQNVIIGDGSFGAGTGLAAGADVGEDCATLKKLDGVSGRMVIAGGAAFKASDKLFQHNANGAFYIRDFYANKIGKLYRSCGNGSTQYARKRFIPPVNNKNLIQ